MKKISNIGNMPPPVSTMVGGIVKTVELFAKETGIASGLEIWECNTVDELSKIAHLDECEFQVLIDKKNTRYYLVAMSVDPYRQKMRTNTTDEGLIIIEEDPYPKPATVLYFTEIGSEEYILWKKADVTRRRQLVMNRIRQGQTIAQMQRGVEVTG